MYRLVKIIARLMLVVFVSTCIVGQCSGAETVEVRMFVLNSDAGLPVVNPRANEVFKITMMAYYKNELIKDLKIISDDFKINESHVEDTLNPNVWHNIFLLKAPEKLARIFANLRVSIKMELNLYLKRKSGLIIMNLIYLMPEISLLLWR